MKIDSEVLSIGFEGMHGVGKTTQITLLQEYLGTENIPYLLLRGDGGRTGTGDHPGNPHSDWWQAYNQALFEDQNVDDIDYWDIGNQRLVREIKATKKRLFPHSLEKQGHSKGVILLDRSIVSRVTFLRRAGRITNPLDDACSTLYDPRVNISDIAPDVIFEFIAPKETLQDRIPIDDKHQFKVTMINDVYDTFYTSKDYLPEDLRKRVHVIDGTKPIPLIHQEILTRLHE